MDEYLAHFRVLENALADCEHLLLHFRGPVCDLSVRPVTAVTGRLRDLLAGQGVPPPPAVCSTTRWLGTAASGWVGMTGDGKGPAGGAGGAWWCPGCRGGARVVVVSRSRG